MLEKKQNSRGPSFALTLSLILSRSFVSTHAFHAGVVRQLDQYGISIFRRTCNNKRRLDFTSTARSSTCGPQTLSKQGGVPTTLFAKKFSEYSANSKGFETKGAVGGAADKGKSRSKNRRGKTTKPFQQNLMSRRERELWLQRATVRLLDTETYPYGTLVKGKWHELHSMMMAWSKLMEEDKSYIGNDGKAVPSQSRSDNSGIEPTTPPLVIEGLLKRIIDERRAGNTDARTTTDMYNLAINAWAVNSVLNPERGTASARRAQEIVRYMQAAYEDENDPDFQPDSHSFLSALGAWAKLSPTDQVDPEAKAHNILSWMEELYDSGRNTEAKPSIAAYSLVLDAYATSGKTNAGAKAEELIRHMQQRGIVKPNTLCYNIMMKAYTKTRQSRDSAETAELILNEMEKLYQTTSDETIKPDVVSYTTAINAWAHSVRGRYGAEQAENILNRMEAMANVQPNTVTYNTVLNAWCKSGHPAAATRTAALLKRMEDQYLAGNVHVKPDLITYNTHLYALSLRRESESAQQAEEILTMLEKLAESGEREMTPNLFTYNTIIDSWAKCRHSHAAQRAHSVLKRLLQRDGLTPDTFSYNKVIYAFSQSRMSGAAQKAEELLKHMENDYRSGNLSAKPDVFSYSSAINAWSRSGEKGSALRGEKLLERMEQMYVAGHTDLRPNTVTYNSVIDAWAKAREGTFGARRAEALLQKMEDLFQAGDMSVRPNSITYNAVLNSWARSGTRCCARKAESYLNRMWQLYEAGDKHVKPDICSYNTLINAISKSQNEGKAQKALRILRRMDKLYRAGNRDTRPNEFTYTSVLNSCAFSVVGDQKVKRKALDTAIFTLEELQGSRYGRPNHITYGVFLKACANLLPMDDEMRRILIEPVFLQCCKDGQVGELVLTQLRVAAPPDLYSKLLGGIADRGTEIHVQDLPPEWRCNVRDSKPWRDRVGASRKTKPGSFATEAVGTHRGTRVKPRRLAP